MKNLKSVFFTLIITALAALPVFAVDKSTAAEKTILTIGSGGESGIYYPVVSEINNFCSSPTIVMEHYMVEGKSMGGSVNNKNNLLNNLVMLGIIQADVAHLEKMKNAAMKRVEAVVPLHKEQVHVIVPAISRVMVQEAKAGKFGTSFGAQEAVYADQENPLDTLSQLASRKVAAWGGSVVTAKVIKMMSDIGFEIVDAENQEKAMKLLNKGEVDAVLAVVGSPAPWVGALPAKQFKLLTVTKDVQDKLSDIYSTSSVNYDNMGPIGQNIDALSVDSILFTRTYRTPVMRNAIDELQKCIKAKIYDIQDTPGTNPVWQSIDPTREIKWDNIFKK